MISTELFINDINRKLWLFNVTQISASSRLSNNSHNSTRNDL